jgi:hypothetical protein
MGDRLKMKFLNEKVAALKDLVDILKYIKQKIELKHIKQKIEELEIKIKALEGEPKCESEVIRLKGKLKEMKSRGTRIESLINKF